MQEFAREVVNCQSHRQLHIDFGFVTLLKYD
jgi:hypothetical protein